MLTVVTFDLFPYFLPASYVDDVTFCGSSGPSLTQTFFVLLLLDSRGRSAAARRTSQELLHGAELPRPQPGPAAAGEPGRCRGGRGQRQSDGGAVASLAGRAAGGLLVRLRRLLDGPQHLSGHAALPTHRVELRQPRSKIRTEPAQRGWADKVAGGRTEGG